MITIQRPEIAVLNALLWGMEIKGLEGDGRYLVSSLQPPADGAMLILRIDECEPGDAEALKNTGAFALVEFRGSPDNPRRGVHVKIDKDATGGTTTLNSFYFDANVQMATGEGSLGVEIAQYVINQFAQ